MKRLRNFAQLACAITTGVASVATAASIGANFLGRNATTSLLPTEKAGFVEQAFWNNIDDSATTPAESGTSFSLRDDSGNFTAATVTFKGNDSWESDGPSDTPNARLSLGIIKQQKAGTTGNYSINNLGAGPYDVILYTSMNGDGVKAEFTVGGVTKPVIEEHQFSGSYVEATAGTAGNYIKFAGVTPTAGTIGLDMKYISGADGAGLAGIQVVGTSFPANTVATSITTQPVDSTVAIGSRGGFFVKANAANLNFQWFKNDAAIAGATSASLATAPTTAGDDGAKYKVTVANNVNTVTSSVVVLHALAPVLAKGFLKAEFFTGIGGGTKYEDLLASDKFKAGVADQTKLLVGFDTPNGYGDQYGVKVSGFIIPKVTGNYNFFIRSDDGSALFISSDATEAKLGTDPIAVETGCCNAFKDPGAPQTSDAIPLTAGKTYFIVAYMKEGGGGDFLQVAMREENDTTATGDLKPIAGNLIGTFVLPDATVTVVTQPVSVSVTELSTATFKVAATAASATQGPVPIRYQWQKNGVDIAGATDAIFIVPAPTLGDSLTKYQAIIGAPGAPDVTSTQVTLTVLPDTIPPVILSVAAVSKKDAGIEVSVLFDEPLTTAPSLTLANFKLNTGAVTAARYVENTSGLDSRQHAIVLTTTGLTLGTSYTLTVSGIKDLKGNTSGSVVTPFSISKLTWVDLARPSTFVQDVVATGTNGFNVVNGGAAYWGSDDDATFIYEEITGDFDKVARVDGQDPSSNWARAGIAARESLDAHGETASRYQQVHANPSPKKFDGTDSNQGFETNRRLIPGGATSSSNGDNGANGPRYPNAWLRLIRTGDKIHMLRSADGLTWVTMGRTDFNPADPGGTPLAAKMFVGLAFGSENGNIVETSRGSWVARFREYGDFKNTAPVGKQTYSIGINFTDDNRDGTLGQGDVAGTDATAQAHWNNAQSLNTTDSGPLALTGDEGGVAKTTTATVEWSGSGNTWASTGRGEENNPLTGPNHLLMSGFLDTSADSTTKVEFKGLGAKLTGAKYDVVVYALGGVAGGRGGAYRVTDGTGAVLKDYVLALSDQNPATLKQVPINNPSTPGDGSTYGVGSYIVFRGLSAANIIVEGTTQNADINGTSVDLGVGGTQRAPINAIQLVSPSGLFTTTIVPTIKIEGLKITFVGKLLRADTVGGPFAEVAGATSPFTIDPASASSRFFRAGK